MLRNVTFVSKRENFEVPILGPLIELGDAHPIERGGDDGALDFFEKLLKQGHCITIFPEGTIPAEEDKLRSDVEPETGLLKGKTGAIRLALRAQVPIVPCGISGSGRALCPEAIPRGEKLPLPKPSKISITFGKPIYYHADHGKPFSRERLRELTNTLMKKISELVDHSMNYIPQEVPVSPKTYATLRDVEAKTRPHHVAKTA